MNKHFIKTRKISQIFDSVKEFFGIFSSCITNVLVITSFLIAVIGLILRENINRAVYLCLVKYCLNIVWEVSTFISTRRKENIYIYNQMLDKNVMQQC